MSDYDMTIAELETELDATWPEWDVHVGRAVKGVKGRPFNTASAPSIKRIKWLLKRREQLWDGLDAYGVNVAQAGHDPRKCFAVPTEPPADPADRPAPPPKVA